MKPNPRSDLVYRGIELAGCFPITMPVDGDGMMTEGLADIVEKRRPKFIYVNSSYQDPTGNVMTVERRRNLLDVSARFGVPIIEEDGASELYYEDSEFPTLKSMDEHNNVVYIYSFALTFVPGISVAVVVGDPVLIHAMQYLVSVRVISIGWLTQRLVARYLKNGKYRAKIDEMEATATSGGGAVTVTVSGKKEIKDLQIKPEVCDPDDVEMLQDLVIAAANEALRQMEEISQAEMSKFTSGLGIPGL